MKCIHVYNVSDTGIMYTGTGRDTEQAASVRDPRGDLMYGSCVVHYLGLMAVKYQHQRCGAKLSLDQFITQMYDLKK